LIGNHHQRVNAGAMQAPLSFKCLGLGGFDQAILDHQSQHFGEGKTVFVCLSILVHAGQYSARRNAL